MNAMHADVCTDDMRPLQARGHRVLLATLATAVSCVAFAAGPETAPAPIGMIMRSDTIDCTKWTLDGYRLGMTRDEILAVRSVTLHVEGQAQVVEPGKLSGVLVLAPTGLAKWDVKYETKNGDALRAELTDRFGGPFSDGDAPMPGDDATGLRRRATIWRDGTCDVAIVVSETASKDGSTHLVQATLARASSLSRSP